MPRFVFSVAARMSALGHEWTFPDVQRMAALTRKADMRGRIRVAIYLFVYESTP
jgi:hypothetical protein